MFWVDCVFQKILLPESVKRRDKISINASCLLRVIDGPMPTNWQPRKMSGLMLAWCAKFQVFFPNFPLSLIAFSEVIRQAEKIATTTDTVCERFQTHSSFRPYSLALLLPKSVYKYAHLLPPCRQINFCLKTRNFYQKFIEKQKQSRNRRQSEKTWSLEPLCDKYHRTFRKIKGENWLPEQAFQRLPSLWKYLRRERPIWINKISQKSSFRVLSFRRVSWI